MMSKLPYDEPTANLSSIGDHLPAAPILDTTKYANQHNERSGNVMQTTAEAALAEASEERRGEEKKEKNESLYSTWPRG